MKNTDLLKELYRKRITLREANKILGEAIDEGGNPATRLNISKKEYKVFLNGMNFKTIAEWRYDGWPTRCMYCSKFVDANKSALWWPRKMKGRWGVVHLKCVCENENLLHNPIKHSGERRTAK